MASKIEENPEKVKDILSSFHSEDQATNDFAESLKQLPAYMVVALIKAFAGSYRNKEPECVGDLMKDKRFVDHMFSLLDGTGYTYVGNSSDGHAFCRPDNSEIVETFHPETAIKWLF